MSNSNQKHRWHDVIIAWTSPSTQWRIKPKTVTRRFRMAILRTDPTGELVCALDTTDSYADEYVEYSLPGFVRWVGEPVEVELEVNDENE